MSRRKANAAPAAAAGDSQPGPVMSPAKTKVRAHAQRVHAQRRLTCFVAQGTKRPAEDASHAAPVAAAAAATAAAAAQSPAKRQRPDPSGALDATAVMERLAALEKAAKKRAKKDAEKRKRKHEEANGDGGDAEEEKEPTKVSKRGKKKENLTPNKPKRPESSYMAFMASRRDEIKQKWPSIPTTDVARMAGYEWDDLRKNHPEQKLRWDAKAAEGKRKYLVALAEWRAKFPDEAAFDDEGHSKNKKAGKKKETKEEFYARIQREKPDRDRAFLERQNRDAERATRKAAKDAAKKEPGAGPEAKAAKGTKAKGTKAAKAAKGAKATKGGKKAKAAKPTLDEEPAEGEGDDAVEPAEDGDGEEEEARDDAQEEDSVAVSEDGFADV